LICSYNLAYFYFFQVYLWLIFLSLPLSFIWFISCLAETNRTPFDFAERESELVSGFNVEYGSGGFALIFLAEYASILFMRLLFCIIFLGSDLFCLFGCGVLCLDFDMISLCIWLGKAFCPFPWTISCFLLVLSVLFFLYCSVLICVY
jgi:NADH:ubiquinone oxidoreductase subunit H